MMDGDWQQVPPQQPPPLSAIQARQDSSEGAPALHVSGRTKNRKVLPSDAALEVKKFSVSKTQVSYQILVIPCEIPDFFICEF